MPGRRDCGAGWPDEGLEPPVPRWAETAFLGVLGIGDLTMTSVSFMVLNISDRLFVSWLPFSALTLAAIPVVGGMLGAAHFLGESIRARRHEPGLRQVIIGAASLAGGLCLALSVAAIRSAFLAANGVMTLSLPFIGIQVGLFAVATAASTWAAHPFQAQWKAAARAVRRAAAVLPRGSPPGRQAGWHGQQARCPAARPS